MEQASCPRETQGRRQGIPRLVRRTQAFLGGLVTCNRSSAAIIPKIGQTISSHGSCLNVGGWRRAEEAVIGLIICFKSCRSDNEGRKLKRTQRRRLARMEKCWANKLLIFSTNVERPAKF